MKKHKIDWLNIPGYKGESWNPIVGCSKVSPGCDNCYAEKMAHRIANIELMARPERKEYRNVIGLYSGAKWNGKTYLVESALSKPSKWKKPRAIFVNSMGDLFHENTLDENIDAVFDIIENNPQHLFLILTKRAKRMYKYSARYGPGAWPKNLWLGVTAETQKAANDRIPFLLPIPAEKIFVSIEPMLTRIYLKSITAGIDFNAGVYIDALNGTEVSYGAGITKEKHKHRPLDWVIVGGENGHQARPMAAKWEAGVRNICQQTGIPYFFKQWGEWIPLRLWGEVQETYRKPVYKIDSENVIKVGKKLAGDKINGKQFKQFPKT